MFDPRGAFALDANGTIRLSATQLGTWTQPAGPTSLRIEIRSATTRALRTAFDTTSVSASCVQGSGQSGGQPRVARFCTQP